MHVWSAPMGYESVITDLQISVKAQFMDESCLQVTIPLGLTYNHKLSKPTY